MTKERGSSDKEKGLLRHNDKGMGLFQNDKEWYALE
jgi:hypothetical protein